MSMKRILIRVESHSKSWVWWIESRVFSFCKVLNHDFTFLTNSKFLYETNYFLGKTFYSNYFCFFWVLKEIFTFRNFEIIESNGFRDNLISIINYLIFFPFYKLINTKLFLVIHWNLGIKALKWIKKWIHDFILKIWFKISEKTIVISPELRDFIAKKYKTKNIEIIPNYIDFPKNSKKEETNKFLLVSRLDNAKKPWILKAIEICIQNELQLDIYWGWENLEALKEKYIKIKNIKFLWFKKQDEIDYKKYFWIFAMWRALLEAIANNLVWILISYDEVIWELNMENYINAKYSNFSGRWLKSKKIDLNNLGKDFSEIYKQVKNDFDVNNLEDYYQ